MDQQFQTEDMAFVTYLKINGIEPSRMERKGRIVCWIFERTEELIGFKDEYFSGEAYVEVRDLVQKLAQVRRTMYDALDVQPVRR